MSKILSGFLLLASTLASGITLAQQTAGQPSPEQIKQMQAAVQAQMQMMALMFDARPSKLGFEETVIAIKTQAGKRGWMVGEIQDMQAEMQKAGRKDAKRMKIITICPAHANDKVAQAGGGKAPPLPCRATVFEDKDGKTMVVRMNTSNMAKLMKDPSLAKALAEIGAEEDALYRDILR
ncbi:MAG TPA: DUF302 domain-containing protein [Thiobacillaceae bacterium]|nr:DUF302 domain-containing protein [Thiobacillaceae bacterium]HNU65263.1 DUF302 domain-containing protein [Thiobacillaceae bacterium]